LPCSAWIRTPEQDFSAEKSCEAVARPNASDGEHLSRGRILSRAQIRFNAKII